MSADADNSLPRVRLSPVKPVAEIAPRGRVRVLFGCLGWPSGVLEVASWAKREKLAEPIIIQVRTGNPVDGRFVQRRAAYKSNCKRRAGSGVPLLAKLVVSVAVVREHCLPETVDGKETCKQCRVVKPRRRLPRQAVPHFL